MTPVTIHQKSPANPGRFSSQRIIEIMRNPIYAGQIYAECWNIKTEGKHEPIISLETHYRIQTRMQERGFTKSRKDTSADFPLRGAVACASCNAPLTGGWAKGKRKHYAYYWCPQKGCAEKAKTISRDKIEADFKVLLRSLTPTETMLEIFKDMLKPRWDERTNDVAERKEAFEREAAMTEGEISKLVQRIVATDNERVAEAFETEIEKLQQKQQVLTEKSLNAGQATLPFEAMFEHSVRYLSTPKKLWDSGILTLRRLVLRLSFSDHLQYARGIGFEHPTYSGPFNIINGLGGVMTNGFNRSCKMVPPA